LATAPLRGGLGLVFRSGMQGYLRVLKPGSTGRYGSVEEEIQKAITLARRKVMDDELPPEYAHLVALIDEQSPEVREALHFLLAVALEESGKARLLNISQIEGRVHYSYQTIVGDVFTVVRPEMDHEKEEELRAMAAAILGGEK